MTKIVYHSADHDGKTSGAILYNHLKNSKGGCSLYGMDYHETAKIEQFMKEIGSEDIVYMADISFKLPQLEELHKKLGDKFILIDHHASLINDLASAGLTEKIKGLRTTKFAASILCWMYLYPDKDVPKTVEYIGKYDVKDYPPGDDVEKFHYGLDLLDIDPSSPTWTSILKSEQKFIDEILITGTKINDYLMIINKDLNRDRAFERTIEGFKTICINTPQKGDKVFESVLGKYEMQSIFSHTGKPNTWSVSFYCNNKLEHVDCSKIAKKYGGGGHKSAAGMTCDFETLRKLFDI